MSQRTGRRRSVLTSGRWRRHDGVRATQVSVLREEVRAALTASVEPLRQYLATYEIYLEFLRLDVDAYVSQAEDDYGGPPPGAISAF